MMIQAGSLEMSAPAYDFYRITCGVPSSNELNESFNPYDIGLRDAISFTKGCYVGQEVIARLDTYQKIRKGLVSLGLKTSISHNTPLPVSTDSEDIGWLTSMSVGSVGGRFVALAVLKTDGLDLGQPVRIRQQSSEISAIITKIF
jgi:folate-binding protein YgfZ